MSRESTKTALLDAGGRIILERGFNHSGIETILHEAGVPKGSFYHYFSSKEDFGLQVLNRFAARVDGELDRYLNDRSLPPLDRLRRLGEAFCEKLASSDCRHGCMVGNLSQEMADQNEVFRSRLAEIFRGWGERYAGCLREAQMAGAIPPELDVAELAEFWLNAWQGSLIRAKTARSIGPLKTFLNLMFGSVLRREVELPPNSSKLSQISGESVLSR